MMPLYLACTAAILFYTGHRSPRPYAAAVAGFAVPALLFVP